MNDFSYFSPPEDGLRLAMTDARRRRYRTAGFSTGSVAAAVLVLAALAGGQATQSLVEQPAPQQPAVTHVIPDGDRRTTSTSNTVGVVTGRHGAAGAAPARDRTTTDQVAASNRGSATGTGPVPVATTKPYAAGPLVRNDSTGYLPTDANCPVNGGAQTLCPYTQASSSGSPRQLYGEVCSTKAQDAPLHFATSNEVDFAIYRGTTLVWQWSRWHPERDAPHTLMLRTGTCSQWTFDWSDVDFRGAKLPKGDYTLQTTFLADEMAGKEISRATFSIS